MPQLKTDPRFAERNTRIANRDVLRGIIEGALSVRSALEWERLFNDAGVPAGPILNVPDVVKHQQIEDRGLIKRFDDAPGVGRRVEVTRLGFTLASGQPDVDRSPPVLGQDTDDVLKRAGYSDADIAAFRAAGAI